MDSISVKGFKSFKDVTVQLKPINILIGANGSGKSNFLSLFELLGNAYEGLLGTTIIRHGGQNNFLHKGGNVTDHISIKTVGDNHSYKLDLIPSGEVLMVENETIGYISETNKWNYECIAHLTKETELKWYTGEPQIDYIKKYMSQIKKFHFHDTGLTSPLTRVSNIENDIFYLYSKGENIAAFLYNIRVKEPLIYKRIVRIIQSVAPYFRDFFLSQMNSEI